jgi:hypothetical protein
MHEETVALAPDAASARLFVPSFVYTSTSSRRGSFPLMESETVRRINLVSVGARTIGLALPG